MHNDILVPVFFVVVFLNCCFVLFCFVVIVFLWFFLHHDYIANCFILEDWLAPI